MYHHAASQYSRQVIQLGFIHIIFKSPPVPFSVLRILSTRSLFSTIVKKGKDREKAEGLTAKAVPCPGACRCQARTLTTTGTPQEAQNKSTQAMERGPQSANTRREGSSQRGIKEKANENSTKNILNAHTKIMTPKLAKDADN